MAGIAEVGGSEDPLGRRGALDLVEAAILRAEPEARGGSIAWRPNVCEEQIDCAVIVEVGGEEAEWISESRRCIGNARNFCRSPCVVVIREPRNRAVGLDGEQIESAAVTRVGGGDGFSDAEFRKRGDLVEASCALVVEDVQLTCGVKDRSIGISIAIEIGPYELLESRDAGEGMEGREGAVAVIAEDGRCTRRRAKNDVKIAVGFDV